MLDTDNTIEVQGACIHSLKNIDVSIKRYRKHKSPTIGWRN